LAVQVTVPPQPFGAVPAHWLGGQGSGLGTHAVQTLLVQVSVPEQLPQLRLPPQPLEMLPQFLPCAAQVVGVQPQTLAVPPPPQLLGLEQLPQLRLPPQPLEMEPQSLP